jgi:hypothetical protein
MINDLEYAFWNNWKQNCKPYQPFGLVIQFIGQMQFADCQSFSKKECICQCKKNERKKYYKSHQRAGVIISSKREPNNQYTGNDEENVKTIIWQCHICSFL